MKRLLLLILYAPLVIAQIVNTGNHRAIFTPVSCTTCVLDSVSVAPVTAYALRKLRAAYAGKAVNVIRASDSTSSDIGFNANGTLNTTALNTFCSGTTCTVAIWYDQSGNGTNAVQPTVAYQPVLVSAGTIQTINGLPALNSNASGTAPNELCISSCGANVLLYANFVNAVIRASIVTASANHYPVILRQNSGTGAEWALRLDDSGSPVKYNIYRVAIGAVTAGTVDTSAHVISADSSAAIYLDGTSIGTSSSFINTSTTAAASAFADPNSSPPTEPWVGYVGELFDFSTTLGATDRTTLENNQKSYFVIP